MPTQTESQNATRSTLTRDQLATGIQRVDNAINAWNAAEGPRVDWRGRNVKCISERLIAIFGSLFDLTETSLVAQDIKRTVLAIDDFAEAVGNWAANCESMPDETHPGGDEELWKAWKMVGICFAKRKRATPNHIHAYIDQRLNDRQIALQYHWVDELGEPDINKVQDEKLKPGTHFDPDKWVHPLDVADNNEVNSLWDKRSVRVTEKQASAGVIPEAPESIYELLKQRVGSKQILMMKPGSTIEGIRAVAKQHDLEVDGVKVYGEANEPLTGANGNESVKNSGSAPGVLPSALFDGDDQKRGFLVTAVKELQESGQTPEEIVESMSEDFPDLTVDHVAMVQAEIASAAIAGL